MLATLFCFTLLGEKKEGGILEGSLAIGIGSCTYVLVPFNLEKGGEKRNLVLIGLPCLYLVYQDGPSHV